MDHYFYCQILFHRNTRCLPIAQLTDTEWFLAAGTTSNAARSFQVWVLCEFHLFLFLLNTSLGVELQGDVIIRVLLFENLPHPFPNKLLYFMSPPVPTEGSALANCLSNTC